MAFATRMRWHRPILLLPLAGQPTGLRVASAGQVTAGTIVVAPGDAEGARAALVL